MSDRIKSASIADGTVSRQLVRPLCECGLESWIRKIDFARCSDTAAINGSGAWLDADSHVGTHSRARYTLHSSTRDLREETHMTFISIFHRVRRKGRDCANTEIVEADDELTNDSAEQLPIVKDELTAYFRVLDERISELERENADLRSENGHLRMKVNENGLTPIYWPSPLAQQILITFCALDTTVMLERDLVAAYSESTVEIKKAVSELCQHKLLAVLPTGPTSVRSYTITLKAQQLVFRFARGVPFDPQVKTK
jgi:hypothetical protein